MPRLNSPSIIIMTTVNIIDNLKKRDHLLMALNSSSVTPRASALSRISACVECMVGCSWSSESRYVLATICLNMACWAFSFSSNGLDVFEYFCPVDSASGAFPFPVELARAGVGDDAGVILPKLERAGASLDSFGSCAIGLADSGMV